ncbi:MAG: DUF4340 domain-containing protein [Xanthomonadaceae bacterium]|nr:DUF4340 domain-containing protein [Xanthomonadaceae bacterium]
MSRNRFTLLVVVTLTAALAVIVLSRSVDDQHGASAGVLLPALEQSVNEIAAIDVVAPGGTIAVTLRRDDERWRVLEKDGYEADFARVIELLRSLRQAQKAGARTANPEWYSKLGVQPLASDDATGRRLDFPGQEIASVIIGQTDPTGNGSYARRVEDAQSWLLDEVIEVPVDPVVWLERGVMDIPAEDITEVVIRHADGEMIRIARAGDNDPEFVLRNVPEGRQAGPPRLRRAIASGLRGLNLEDVRRHQPPVPADAARLLFVTTDGLNFVADIFEREARYWVHFTVSAENAATGATAPSVGDVDAPDGAEETAVNPDDETGDGLAANADATSGPTEAIEERDAVEQQAAQRLANAVAVDARLSPWIFAIPERRYNDLTKRMEDLLEPVEEE